MLQYFTDAQTDMAIAVNPNFVVVVFVAKDEATGTQKTVINTTTGNLVVKEDYISVVGQLQGVL